MSCKEIPQRFNFNEVEITIMIANQPILDLHIIGIYRSKSQVKISKLIDALNHLHATKMKSPVPYILLGDFNINLLEETSEKRAIARCLIEQRGYKQLIKQYTTDNQTLIDHIFTNVPHLVVSTGVLESYYSDHKPIYISLGAP